MDDEARVFNEAFVAVKRLMQARDERIRALEAESRLQAKVIEEKQKLLKSLQHDLRRSRYEEKA